MALPAAELNEDARLRDYEIRSGAGSVSDLVRNSDPHGVLTGAIKSLWPACEQPQSPNELAPAGT